MHYRAEADLSLKKKAIVCMVVGLIIAAIVVFLQLYLSGIIVLTTEQLVAIVSLLSGVLIAGIILSLAIPVFHRAIHCVKVTGKIIDFEEYTTTYRTSSGSIRHGIAYTPIIEYSVEGQTFSGVKLNTSSSFKPKVGAPIKLRVSDSNYQKFVDTKQVGFMILATIIFMIMAVAFSIPGIIYIVNGNLGNMNFTTPSSPSEMKSSSLPFLIIGGGFAIFWFVLGLILYIVAKNKNKTKMLIQNGTKNVCKITSVVVNTNVEINGEYPIKLTLQNNSGCLFYAKTKGDKHTYEKNQTVDVYVNPDNESVYYVDLDSIE